MRSKASCQAIGKQALECRGKLAGSMADQAKGVKQAEIRQEVINGEKFGKR